MPKPENARFEGMEASPRKQNRGQDEKYHVFIHPTTGETQEATQREYKNTLRDQGFIHQDPEAGDAADVEDVTLEYPEDAEDLPVTPA